MRGHLERLRPAAETDMLPCGGGRGRRWACAPGGTRALCRGGGIWRGENAEFGSSAASGELAFRLHCRTDSAVSLVGYSMQLHSKISVGWRDSKGQDNETRLQSAYDYTQSKVVRSSNAENTTYLCVSF